MENNIQSVIDKVASDQQPTQEEELVENPDQEEEVTPPEDQGEQDSKPEQDSKSGAAFAAMRKEISELRKMNEDLQAQLQSKPEPEPSPDKKEEPQSDEKDEALRKYEERLEMLEAERKKEQEERQLANLAYQLQELQKEHDLTRDDLVEFADAAQKKGIDIANSPLGLKELYVSMNYNKIVEREVERVKKELASNSEDYPSSGPTKTARDSGKGLSINSVLDKIDKETKR